MGADDHRSRLLADVARSMDASAHSLGRQPSTATALTEVVLLSLTTIDRAEHAGVTLVQGEGFTTVAASDALPEQVDSVQYAAREGPCVDASTREKVYRGDDLATDDRWPEFSPRAVGLGVRSMLAVPLFEDDRRSGALNLYSSHAHAFDAEDEAVAVIFAAQASLALARSRERDSAQQLEEALDKSRVISTAVGILMGSLGLTNEQAMDLMRRASQRLNRKVSDLAETVNYTGELPP